jgi:energy-coupling factor transporter ATP-binding protein EcfA2
MLDFPGHCSLLIEAGPDQRAAAINTLQNIMLRLLTSIPPGKIRFTIMDPVGLGQSFAGFMHLADYDDALVSNRIWTDPKHIEKRLTDLTEHMEKVIQKYLRNEFDSIEAYNQSAGEIAEPYRFLIIADYPAAITEASAQRLKSILESGTRCGVYTLILADPASKLPAGLTLEDLERHSLTLIETESGLRVASEPLSRLPLTLESPPDDDFLSRMVRRVGELSKDAGRVEVPFQKITPTADNMWSESCAKELRVPLGRAGATKLQYLTLGRGTSQHVLIAGKTGSGKSTMLHVLVASLAMWYSPSEVEFYLVDFKKGVEFKTYATHRLAHARAVAVESDREFGLSVLHKLDAELKRRGDLYREVGSQDIAGFRERRPDIHMPRTLLIIDEFQEFFVEDDKIAQEAALLLDRLVRQGRAFGMHVLLGSQTLSGAYSLARSTVGQMAVRIALQCSETDSYLILSEDNAAARLLARPGEAIYNDANGMIEGNSPFQIAWLPDSVRDHALDLVRTRVEQTAYQSPEPQIVFEGNVPSSIEDNHELARHLANPTRQMPPAAKAWFGDPVAIKDPTAAIFRRNTGSNCLIVGQQDDESLAITSTALVSLAAQFPRKTARFFLIDATPADDPRFGTLADVVSNFPHSVQVGNWRDADTIISTVAAELKAREEQNLTDEDSIFLVLHGLHRLRALRRKEDDFSFSTDPDAPLSIDKQLAAIIREGPGLGIHTILWADTIGNLERALDRQTIGEFDARILFQMNANDSTVLIDSPAAGRLGQNRALLYSEETGTFEKFRPYAQPAPAYLRTLADALKR